MIALKQAAGFTEMEVRPVRQRPDGAYKSDIDTVITMAVWGAAIAGLIDVVVLASGDSDFLPLVEGLVLRGIEVHVIGPENGTAIELAVAANTFLYANQVPGLVQGMGNPAMPALSSQAQPERAVEKTGSNGNGNWSPHLSGAQPAKAELISQLRILEYRLRKTSHSATRRSR